MISRRSLLGYGVGLTLAGPALSLTRGATGGARFVLVILRGGLDGLAAVPAPGDPAYHRARGALAEPSIGNPDALLDLDGFFALHGRLTGLKSLYDAGELAVLHATAPPYQDRSHFQAQDVLETGVANPSATTDGWLFRSLHLPGAPGGEGRQAMALGGAVPRVLRGAEPVASWTPDVLPEPSADVMQRIQALYDKDPVLGPSLAMALVNESRLGNMQPGSARGDALHVAAGAAGQFLSHPEGPRIAVLESSGWDTHANQAGVLGNRLGLLDDVLTGLKTDLGGCWQETVVLVVTEFGRTVAANGTRGTDHGVGGVALALGGAVHGGRVIADWPGVAPADRFQGRDLMPTTDLRALFRTVLIAHMGLNDRAVDAEVFPDTRLPLLDGLIRT